MRASKEALDAALLIFGLVTKPSLATRRLCQRIFLFFFEITTLIEGRLLVNSARP
jgi:hypothetical protein